MVGTTWKKKRKTCTRCQTRSACDGLLLCRLCWVYSYKDWHIDDLRKCIEGKTHHFGKSALQHGSHKKKKMVCACFVSWSWHCEHKNNPIHVLTVEFAKVKLVRGCRRLLALELAPFWLHCRADKWVHFSFQMKRKIALPGRLFSETECPDIVHKCSCAVTSWDKVVTGRKCSRNFFVQPLSVANSGVVRVLLIVQCCVYRTLIRIGKYGDLPSQPVHALCARPSFAPKKHLGTFSLAWSNVQMLSLHCVTSISTFL